MALGTPFDWLELGVLLAVAAALTLIQPWLVPQHPTVQTLYMLLAGGASLASAALVRSLRRRRPLTA